MGRGLLERVLEGGLTRRVALAGGWVRCFAIFQRELVLVEDSKDWPNRVFEAFGATEMVVEGRAGASMEVKPGSARVVSFDAKECQIDLIAVHAADFEFSLKYLSFNDLGPIIGQAFQRMNCKFGHAGVEWVEMDSKGQVFSVPVTNDFETALVLGGTPSLPFLLCVIKILLLSLPLSPSPTGFSPERFAQGFDTPDDVFIFALTSTLLCDDPPFQHYGVKVETFPES